MVVFIHIAILVIFVKARNWKGCKLPCLHMLKKNVRSSHLSEYRGKGLSISLLASMNVRSLFDAEIPGRGRE